jgi:hypothetical protein
MMDCLISFPLWDTLVLALPPLYYYKYQSSLAIERQVESLVSYSIYFPSPLLPGWEPVMFTSASIALNLAHQLL